ncbi:MAG TPA: hypothetical protein VK783_07970 [Bacteroidia bacterium]|nr:hypothetical protein [Bacteroidia bacterium]
MKLDIKQIPRQRLIALCILFGLFIYALIILVLSDGSYDTGDGVTHYLISRYSWKHPLFLLDEWGKPLFTMISSPFSQFGMKGIEFFNILCSLTASYLAYRIAEKLNIPFPYLAIVLTFSAPVFFGVIYSGLTEPLFALMVIWSVWLVMNEKYYLSAIVFSFFPFVRADYIYLFPVFTFYYVLKKKYLANFLLPVGTIIITLLGYFHYRNLHWLIDQNPYSIGTQAYGTLKGDMFSYIGNGLEITGKAFEILIAIGLLWYAGGEYFKKYSRALSEADYHLEEIMLIFGGFLGILLGQTLVWATGICQTLGPTRYMVPLIPLASIIALRGLQLVTILLDKIKMHWLNGIIAIGFGVAVLYAPYTLWYKIPYRLGAEDAVIKKAADWLKQSPDAGKKVFYIAPYITVALDIDPNDTSKNGMFFNMDPQRPDLNMPQGSVMMWDSHYGPNEGRIKLDTLLKNPNLVLLKKFDPDEKFTVIGGLDYGIWVFQRK